MVKSKLIERIINKFTQLPAEEVEKGVYQILECLSETLSKGVTSQANLDISSRYN